MTSSPATFVGGALGVTYLENDTTTSAVVIPAGSNRIGLLTTTGFTSLKVTGRSSGALYGTEGSHPAGGLYSYPCSGSPDELVDFVIVTGPGQAGTVYVKADSR